MGESKHVRGEPPFLSPERRAWFHMYDESAGQALNELKSRINSGLIRRPLCLTAPDLSKMCVAVMTARRVGSTVQYLRQSIGSLLARTSLPNNEMYIHMYNVYEEPGLHREVDLVKDLLPVTVVKAETPTNAKFFKERFTSQIQESLDYSVILRDLADKGCPTALLLEDDALPSEHWWEHTKRALEELDIRAKNNWFMVRLFTARWRGWYMKRYSEPIITANDQGFNGVAILINGMYLKKFADSMDEAANAYLNGGAFFEAKDIYFGVFKRETGLPIEALEPGPFQHTGIYSSRHLRDTNSFAWYMASRNFESEGKPVSVRN